MSLCDGCVSWLWMATWIRYRGLPANGTWSLSLYDPTVDGLTASLQSWGVRVHVGPCQRRYKWNQLIPVRVVSHLAFEL